MKVSEASRVLLDDREIYVDFVYRNEKELELLATKNKNALFGNDSIYFDIKKIISSNANISKIPDGLLLTTTNFQDSRLWIVEYELSTHDLERHIYPQIMGFINALRNESTKRSVREIIYANLKKDSSSIKKIRSIIPSDGEIYHFLENILERSANFFHKFKELYY